MYVELHARSAFSFLQGASLPEELAQIAADRGMGALALLDRDGVYGSPRFHQAAKKLGIRAHIGAEVSVDGAGRWPLLARDRTGYRNLCRLITRYKLRSKKGEGSATAGEMAEHAEGLVCLTGGDDGPLAEALRRGGMDEARREAERLAATFGRENVYAELQRHYDPVEEARNQAVVEIARGLGLPLLATNGVAHATGAQREVLDVFTCLRNHATLKRAGRLLSRNAARHLRSPAAMARLFRDLPEAVARTEELSARLGFTLADLGYEFPRYPVPYGETMMSFLRRRADEGARQRYRPYHEKAQKQIERELALIAKLELAGYFLIVWDIVCYCREAGILIQGRGSAANSAVCYALGITAVDPVGMDLLFERFLSEERGEWPDIDLDLPSGDQREKVIQHVYERYGQLGAAMTANVITYRGRSAVREVGKVLDFEPADLGRLSSLVSRFEWKDPKDTDVKAFREAGFELADPRIVKFLQLYRAVQDLPRHLGQHSGGMVVCQGQLDAVVPLEPASMPGRVVVQWDKDDCADVGIVKVDLLGLGMMAVLEESITLIRDAWGEEVDLAHLPADDPDVYAALQKADTVGLFQVESRAQMSCLPRLKPKNFYDIVVEVAIIRPGPIVGNMVHPYLKRRAGREDPVCLHPSLEPVLRRTLGVPLFQEQLLRMAMIAAGFSGGEAEELRRAFGFKRSERRMKDVEVKLRRGMERNGITGEAQDGIVKSITSFALYGFPESHAASFALLAYASAWLRCHYPAAFTAALLNNQPMGFYHPATLVKDAQRHGVRIRPVDVARSQWDCTIEVEPGGDAQRPPAQRASEGFIPERAPGGDAERPPAQRASEGFTPERAPGGDAERPPAQRASEGFIPERAPGGDAERPPAQRASEGFTPERAKDTRYLRLGLRYVRGLRADAGRAIVAERARGPYAGIDDLARRVPALRKDEMATLAEAGALNFIRPQAAPLHRRDALWHAARAMRPPGEMFSGIPQDEGPSPLAPMTPDERLEADYRDTGLTIGPHPMAARREELRRRGVMRAVDLLRLPNGLRVQVAGAVICRQRPGTAKGFLFLSLEDETGIANGIVTPDLFDANRAVLVGEPFIIVDGMLQHQDGVVSVKVQRVEPCPRGAAVPSHDFR